MDNEVSNTFYEVQAEKFHQKKVEVARGVIELGQILIDTKAGLKHGEWIKWLEDSRVGFKDSTARKYMTIARDPQIVHGMNVLDNISLNKLYTLALAPEEVKEDVANSKDKEEAEKKIKEYERQLKEEREAKETVIKNNEELQEKIKDINEKRENDIKSARDEGIKIGRDSKLDEEKEKLRNHYKEQYDKDVSKLTDNLKISYQDKITRLGNELESVEEELSHYKDVLYKDKEVNREYQRLNEQSKKLQRKIDELENWGTLEANLDLAIAQATALVTGDISTNEDDNEVLIISVSRTVNRLRKLIKLLEDNFDIIGGTTIYKEDGIEIIDVEDI